VLRKYEVSDRIEYNYNFDETYYDGSGSYAENELLVWVIEDDPNEYSHGEGDKSFLAKFITDKNGFEDVNIVERLYQYSSMENNNQVNGLYLSSNYDGVMTDNPIGSPDKLKCPAYNVEEDTCYSIAMTPGTFDVGVNWSFEGVSSRGNCVMNIDWVKVCIRNYESIINWNVESKEIIETAIGSFETYKLVQHKELIDGDTRYETDVTYWYYPTIGVVKADMVKKKIFKETGTYVTYTIDYSITSTNIPY
jgi:hypothetical protein